MLTIHQEKSRLFLWKFLHNLKKKTYEGVGMHEGVKQEIIEDGALGKKVKESGHTR